MRLAVIPARSGSKRLPGKNIRTLAGKPLIGWVLQAAREAQVFDDILVTTDSAEIAQVAQVWGGWAPFLRPVELASDSASSVDVLLHAVKWAAEYRQPEKYSLVALLQPTSPFVGAGDIRAAVNFFEGRKYTTLSSMTQVKEFPSWMFQVDASGRAKPLDPIGLTRPSAELPNLYRENGAIFIVRYDYLMKKRALYDLENHGGFLMAHENSVDIDTPEDWGLAEWLAARLTEKDPNY